LSEESPKPLADKLQVFIDIARMRRGPEDLPFDHSLLVVTVLAYGLLNLGIGLLLPHPVPPLPLVLIDIAVTLAALHWILQLANKRERFVQSAAAVFGFQIVLAPLVLIVAWLAVRYGKDDTWQLPVGLLYYAVDIWVLAAASRILRSATGWPMLGCVALTIAVDMCARLIIVLLFPAALDAAAQA
jgi:hypothetical protein